MELMDIILLALFIGLAAGVLIGAAIGITVGRNEAPVLGENVIAAMREVERLDEPRQVDWTPEVAAKWRIQQAARRQ